MMPNQEPPEIILLIHKFWQAYSEPSDERTYEIKNLHKKIQFEISCLEINDEVDGKILNALALYKLLLNTHVIKGMLNENNQ